MRKYTPAELKTILEIHKKWLNHELGSSHADLTRADLTGADLTGADLTRANLTGADLTDAYLTRANLTRADLTDADLTGADLTRANLTRANLTGADLTDANLTRANLTGAYLTDADLTDADLTRADLTDANLTGADLTDANLTRANLTGAYLTDANLTRANLTDARGLVKTMGVTPGNYYWKRFEKELINRGYQFYVGINELRKNEIFAENPIVTCSYPGFHFASRSWCAVNYPHYPYEALIQIPIDAKINEPWATDGKASADKIIIIQVFDTASGEDVTQNFIKKNN
jgi:hypothetical protein